MSALTLRTAFCSLIFGCVVLWGQNPPEAQLTNARADLDAALEALAEARQNIAEAKIPLATELNARRAEVLELRQALRDAQREATQSGLSQAQLETETQARREDLDYVRNLFTELARSLEVETDPSEFPALEPAVRGSLLALDVEAGDPPLQALEPQEALLEAALSRLEGLLGGKRIEGPAVIPSGRLAEGSFLLYGPVTYFVADSGLVAGVSVAGDAGTPRVLAVDGSAEALQQLFTSGEAAVPLDASQGRALALQATEDTFVEHIAKGGFWIWPILGFAAVAFIVAAYKAFELFSIREPRGEALERLLQHVREDKLAEAQQEAKALPGPSAAMLATGLRHARADKALLEEILVEKMVETQPRLEHLLPVIAVTAATAPLLGLLGTVTGMINTFKLITVFGTGDAKQLSSGISEALITTEFGLIVAIPALILHALLTRRARGIMSRMETTALQFLNVLGLRTPPPPDPGPGQTAPAMTPAN